MRAHRLFDTVAGSRESIIRDMSELEPILAEARGAFRRRDWVVAREQFLAARSTGTPLSADDVYSLSDAAWWLGLVEESMSVAEEAYHLYLADGRGEEAAMAGLNIAYTNSLRGNESLASAWGARSMRIVDELPECAVHGFIVYLAFETAFAELDFGAALGHAHTVAAMGERFNDANLRALGVMAEGRVFVRQGRVSEGMALLDEAMLAALSPDLDPSWAGNIYCHLMLACHELADLRRATEWTRATARWCESMPGAGPFMGICRVHRAQVLQVQGEWQRAELEVRRVCDELAHFHLSIVAEAYYELGEVLRRRGDLANAEAAFRDAHRRGRDPQPGLALLRLAQGNHEAAAGSLDAFLAGEPQDPLQRLRHLAARVEVALATGDLGTARRGCEEVESTAAIFGSSGLQAVAAHLRGATLLAEARATEALPILRQAFRCWHELGAPYESARVRLLIAEASDRMGDSDTASLERDAASATLRALGDTATTALPGGLTPRELEVLLLAADGRSNADIARLLVLSVRTVERHLATVYDKLGFEGRNARSAAVSFALREGLTGPRTGQD